MAWGRLVTELHAMLKLYEQTLPKKDDTLALHAIRAGKVQKKIHKNKKPQLAARGNNQRKEKFKLSYAPKPKIPPPPKKENPAKDAICHQYSDVGIILVSHLYDDGFINRFENNCWDIKTDDFIDAVKDYYCCWSSWKRLSESLDNLKEHVIIAHHTPLYTPQHNGVSKRRNRTLLDMVRSMISQTTLLMSFWDYAFESPARILNMVPTKKDLVDLPPDGKIVGSKWLFKKKTSMDEVVQTYKARLVAKGLTQTYGVDYEKTFSPVADIRAIRILVAIPASYDYEI
uniref:Uncharacterized mitochondrial protein AtMg00820-like n=1 Tax=Tanacetum cinerariifolium TaxID=118510 RepID=A0A6L2N9P4_TANCI|nr:uncharacterized mitochondrial protein AtMg00820-like [Tanacetum cinerariifolium]